MSILNLRKVCKETKQWVDHLRPTLSNRVYNEIIAHVDFNDSKATETLRNFKANQPPPALTSLRKETPKLLLAENEHTKQLVDFFCDFWSIRLHYLEVDNYVDGLLELFENVPIRVLHIETMDCWPDLESKFYHIKEIYMRWEFEGNHVPPMENPNIKRFYIAYGDKDGEDSDEQLEGIKKNFKTLLSSKPNNTDFSAIKNQAFFYLQTMNWQENLFLPLQYESQKYA